MTNPNLFLHLGPQKFQTGPVMRPYNLVEIYRTFGATCLNVQGGCHSFPLKTEAVRYFVTSVNFYQPTPHYISEDLGYFSRKIFRHWDRHRTYSRFRAYYLTNRFTCSRKTSFCCWHDPLRSQTFRTTDGTGSLSSHLQIRRHCQVFVGIVPNDGFCKKKKMKKKKYPD